MKLKNDKINKSKIKMRPLTERIKAIELRRAGKTYAEIKEMLGPIPKGTLNGWFKTVELTSDQRERIILKMKDRSALGRERAGRTNHQKRLTRLDGLRQQAINEWPEVIQKPTFLAGLTLYIAEGSKRHGNFQFMNSDPDLVRFMVSWIEDIGLIPKGLLRFRLYTHRQYASDNLEKYWSNYLGVDISQFKKTVYKPTRQVLKKNPQYKGCLRIEIPGSALFWKILTWRDKFYSLYS